jgi:dTDP-4-dehydrorhamnose reductase
MNNNILVLGSSGFLGSNFMDYGKDKFNYFFASSSRVIKNVKSFSVTDYSSENLLHYCDQNNIKTIINCVGFTEIEKIDANLELNRKLNYDFPLRISEFCLENSINLIHFSTDHFESKNKTPRYEDSKVFAVNEYAQTKLKAEKILLENKDVLIIRTNFFGHNETLNSKLFDWALNRLKQNLTIEGFTDVFFTPISVSILVQITNDLIDLDAKGIINVVGSESISKFHFLSQLSLNLGIVDDLVRPISIVNSTLKVKRTNYLSLSNKKLMEMIPGKYKLDLDHMISKEISRYEASRAKITSGTTPK